MSVALSSHCTLVYTLEFLLENCLRENDPGFTAVDNQSKIKKVYPEIRELQRSIETYDMPYFPPHILLCTSTVHDQSGDICIQGYLRILWIGNTKSSKIDKIHKRYVMRCQ